jgi:hypothetical protein
MSRLSFLEPALTAIAAGVLSVVANLPAPAPTKSPPVQQPPASATRPSPPAPEARAGVGLVGHDISWPNCPVGMGIPARPTLGLPLPPASSRFVVIGLTNGPAFYANPCLGEQVAHARRQHLWMSAYAVVTYPTPEQLRAYGGVGPRSGADLAARLWNTGWAQAKLNITNMRVAGLTPPVLWLDVEPVRPPAPWSSDFAANRTVLEGSMAAYREAGLRLGVYSTRHLWQSVVGDVDYGLPEWRAAGPTSRQQALRQCAGESIQGGEAVLAQWVEEIDTNVLCPGRPPADVLREFFTPG